jgi:hypothetical protein
MSAGFPMRTRAEIHQEFVSRFHSGKRDKPIPDDKLDAVEQALNTKLPASYRQFMNRFGVVYTPSILDEIADRRLEFPDLQEFFKPTDAIKNTKLLWSGEMPQDVIGIATDCMGNIIGFRRQAAACDDAPVVFFDHEYVAVSEVASSFDEYLSWYLDNLQGAR